MKLEKFTKEYELLINPDLNSLFDKFGIKNVEMTRIAAKTGEEIEIVESFNKQRISS